MQTRCHALSMLGVLSVAVSALAGGQAGTPEHPSPSRGGEEQARVEQAQALRLARQNGWVLRREGRAGTIELQGIFRGIPLYYTTTNLDAADSLSTDECWPGGSSGLGLTGTGVTLGIWDAGGVRTTHQEFTARATQVDSPSGTHWHSTHVAGTMVAAGLWVDDGTYPDGQSKGMSYAASLSCYDWNDDDAEMAAAAAAGLRVSNHSYGFVTGWRYDDFGPGTGWYWFGDVEVSPTEDYYFGFYSFQAANWDAIAYDHPHYLFVTSAGNDRDEGPSAGTGHWFWDPNLGDWAWSTAARNLDGNNGYDRRSRRTV
jgi:hypothetical protein